MKNKTLLKILSAFLVAVIVICSAPLSGFMGINMPDWFSIESKAAVYSGSCGDNLNWSFDTETGVLNITGTGKMSDFHSSTSVPWFQYRSDIKTVNLPYGITSIGSNAFDGCLNLTEISIPDSVTSIGYYAFFSCMSLVSITIPHSVTDIGWCAFFDCVSLTAIEVDEGNSYYSNDEYGVLFDKNKTTLIRCPSTKEGNYIIPDSVTKISENAFEGCSNLTLVTIPDCVISIDDCAFQGCENLTSLTIPASIMNIGEGAFYNCRSLTAIDVDKDNAHYSSDKYGVLFDKAKTTLICCPAKIEGNYTIPDSVISINDHAFMYCMQLNSVTMGNSVKSIGDSAFDSCMRLTSVTIGNGVRSIGEGAFIYCISLTSVTIGRKVKSIGDYAFFSCDSLTDVYYNGLKTQWIKIDIGDYNTPLTDAEIHFELSYKWWEWLIVIFLFGWIWY